jgi:uncharacterized protein YcfJ
MKTALTAIAAFAGAAMLFPAESAQAQTYGAQSAYGHQSMTYEQCIRQQQNRQVTGAVVGGVLGAVIGAQVHNSTRSRSHSSNYRGHSHHRHYRGGHHNPRHHSSSRRSSNAGAVIAGAGLGALAGASVSNSSSHGCDRYPRAHSAQHHGGYNSYGSQAGYGYDQGYDGAGYYQDNSYSYGSSRAGQYEDNSYGYDDGYASQGVLLGGNGHGRHGNTYSTRSATPAAAGACRYMSASNGARAYMCQGTDGIWRPAESYVR